MAGKVTLIFFKATPNKLTSSIMSEGVISAQFLTQVLELQLLRFPFLPRPVSKKSCLVVLFKQEESLYSLNHLKFSSQVYEYILTH
jgi:hypothetical protein